MSWSKHNFNDKVRVKLTQRGLDIHRDEHERLQRLGLKMEYMPPKIDADGWHETQLWHVIQTWGSAMRMGFDLPMETQFEMSIVMEEKIKCSGCGWKGTWEDCEYAYTPVIGRPLESTDFVCPMCGYDGFDLVKQLPQYSTEQEG